MAQVIVYSMDNCPYCVQAKALLAMRGVPFEEKVIVWEDEPHRNEIFARSGMKTFPQIFHGDVLIGGYSDLKELDDTKGLSDLRS
jgi:glutaredoxin 3